MPEDKKASLGNSVGDFTVLAELGDPTKKAVRTSGVYTAYLIVGYLFKANCDISIPRAPYAVESDKLSDVNWGADVTIKAGETFCLNRMELAKLLSEDKYAGAIRTDDDDEAYLRVAFSKGEPTGTLVLTNGVLRQIPIGDVKKDRNGKVIGIELNPAYSDFKSYVDRLTYQKTNAINNMFRADTKDVAAAFQAYFCRKGN